MCVYVCARVSSLLLSASLPLVEAEGRPPVTSDLPEVLFESI